MEMKRDDPSFDILGDESPALTLVDKPQTEDGGRHFPSGKFYLRFLTVLLVVAITATIFVFRDRVDDLENYGYLGAFLISLITSATIILPVPGIVLIGALGAVYNPLIIGVVAGAGSAFGEITGYMAGYSGQIAVENNKTYQRLERWMRKRGSIVILLLAFVPNPLFDLAGGTSGILKYPIWKFLVICFLGKTARYMLVAQGISWMF